MIDLGLKKVYTNFHETNIYVKNLKVIFNRTLNFRERPPGVLTKYSLNLGTVIDVIIPETLVVVLVHLSSIHLRGNQFQSQENLMMEGYYRLSFDCEGDI